MTNTILLSQTPASFTAQMLHAGSIILTPSLEKFPEESVFYKIGRGCWAWGAGVAAPVGTVYHVASFAFLTIAASWNEEKSGELTLRAWAHINALSYDLAGLGDSVFFGPIALALMISIVAFGVLPIVPTLATSVVVHALYYLLDDSLEFVLWKDFAKDGLAFRHFLPDQGDHMDYYKGVWAYRKALEEKIPIQPLSEDAGTKECRLSIIGSGVWQNSCEVALRTLKGTTV